MSHQFWLFVPQSVARYVLFQLLSFNFSLNVSQHLLLLTAQISNFKAFTTNMDNDQSRGSKRPRPYSPPPGDTPKKPRLNERLLPTPPATDPRRRSRGMLLHSASALILNCLSTAIDSFGVVRTRRVWPRVHPAHPPLARGSPRVKNSLPTIAMYVYMLVCNLCSTLIPLQSCTSTARGSSDSRFRRWHRLGYGYGYGKARRGS